MFLRRTERKKNGKTHHYWNVVENKRLDDGRVVQRHVLYLGEINSSQAAAWRKAIEVFDEDAGRARTLALFPEDRCETVAGDASVVQLRLSEMRLHRPRQWGACWLAGQLWQELQLDRFWADRLPPSRKKTRWDQVLQVLATYRLIDPGSEWRLHRQWFGSSAMADLLGADFGLAEEHKLYACHDLVLEHKDALFSHLVGRWRDLFNADFDGLLYDLTSTYFEVHASELPEGTMRRQHSRQQDAADVPFEDLVGTPKGRLNRLEKHLLDKPWQDAREGVQVKLLAEDGELYVFAQSHDRVTKERAMRRRQLKWLWKRLRRIAAMEISREELLMKLGGARSKAPAAWRLVDVEVDKERPSFTFALNRNKLKKTRRREGRYLLRTNLSDNNPALLWQYYTQLVTVEEAFRNLKGDLSIRPVFHQDETRIEAHIFIAFLAYCMQITLTRRLHALAPGLTARSALEKFAAVQMIDVHLPTTDGREIRLTRHTHPEPELQLLIDRLKLRLPPQPPPRITTAAVNQASRRSEDLLS